jgi:hypothetical protein
MKRFMSIAAVSGIALVLCAAAFAATARPITKTNISVRSIPAGQTRTLTVPYPDALEYGNARYSAHVEVLRPLPGAKGRAPVLTKVRILEKQSVEGGSAYQVRAHNGNVAGTAAVRLSVVATTVEPLPHH